MPFTAAIRYPRTQSPEPLTARQVAKAYNFPLDKTGKGYVGGIIELGGGYEPAQVSQFFSSNGLTVPTFTPVSVDGGENRTGSQADGEVQLDMIVAGSVAPDVHYRVYFAGNTDGGFLAALKQATAECHGVSISWGGPECNWAPQVMDEFEAVIKAARAKGVPVFVAAGDTGATDSSGQGKQTDFPASAPSAIGCGGTRLTLNSAGERVSETVWDDNPTRSATGGGVSQQFPGRQVPDIAGNADPDSGYEIAVNGQRTVVGGTSAVAPLMLGLHALLWEANGGKSFDFGHLVVTNPGCCFDVTVGDNGGYRAGPGRDDCTGFGVPNGGKLRKALASAPVISGPAPQPAPPQPDPQRCCATLAQIRKIFLGR